MTKPIVLGAVLAAAACLTAAGQEPEAPRDDAALRARIERAGDAGANDDADRVVVLRRTTVDVEPSGLAHIRERQVVKCLSEAGAARLARLRFDFDPSSNLVEIRSARVLRKAGTAEQVDPASAVVLPQPQHGIYWGAQMKLLALPRLEVGDAVDVETYMKGFLIAYLDEIALGRTGDGTGQGAGAADDERYIPPMRGHFYDIVYFDDDVPVKERHYTVTVPRDKPLFYEVYGGEVRTAAGATEQGLVYRFWRENLPAWHGEPRGPDAADVKTKVVLATVPDWPAKSRWFAQVNAAQFQADDAIRAKVAELTRGPRGPLPEDEQIAAIVHWVADNIRYSGVTMGKGEGYTLHPAPMIFRNRSGVCKDKAGMAIAMLRAAGFEAFPAMTMAGARVERVAADQFNHCVTALRKKDGTFQLLDPTWVPLSPELWSSAEGEQHYLIGTDAGQPLAITPSFDPAENKVRLESRAELDAHGALRGTLVLSAKGVAEQRLRRDLAAASAEGDRQAFFERLVGGIAPGAEVAPVAVTTAQLTDVRTPLRLTVNYRIPGYALVAVAPAAGEPAAGKPTQGAPAAGESAAGKSAAGKPAQGAPAAGERLIFVPPLARHPLRTPAFAPYWEAAEKDQRTQDVQLGAPRMIEAVETIVLPRGFRVSRLPRERALDGPAAALKTRLGSGKDGLRHDYTLVVKRRAVAVADYGNFRDVVREAKALAEDPVILEREGGR